MAREVAREAGTFLQTRRGIAGNDVVSSIGHDIKLVSDQAADRLILDRLKSRSSIPILTEESGPHGAADIAQDLWIVDPLDGSMNFNRGIPLVCVSIALWRKGQPCIGVVYDFARDEMFASEVGRGAWLNGEPIQVSGVTLPAHGLLATGFPSKALMDDAAMVRFNARARAFKKVRMLGAAALMLSWVACGRLDAYAEDDIMFWDIAAGLAMVKAAGGWISFNSGSGPWQYNTKAAATKGLFPADT